MIQINFLDGEIIKIIEDTILVGIDNAPITTEPGDEIFYLQQNI